MNEKLLKKLVLKNIELQNKLDKIPNFIKKLFVKHN